MAADQVAPGQQDESDLRNAGYGDDQITHWKAQTADTLSQAGYSNQEIADHFGVKEPDVSAMKSFVSTNLKAHAADQKAKRDPVDTSPPPIPAKDFWDNLAAGWGMSAGGLDLDKGKSPLETPENAGRINNLANMAGQIAGDTPAMIVGGAATGFATGVATANPVAAAVGAYAGAQALPKAMRKILMDHYEKGDILTKEDFVQRLKDTTMEALKGGTVGALTGGAGTVVGKFGTPLAQLAAEGATMTAAGAAVEGKLPDANDFVNSAIVMGGLHTLGVIPKLRNIFTNKGVAPEQVAEETRTNIPLRQEMVSDNPELPKEAAGEEKPEKPVLPDRDQPETKPEDKEPDDVEQARKNLRSRLGEDPDKPSSPYSWDKFRTDFEDDLHPVKTASQAMAEGKPLPADQDPYLLMQRAKNWRAQLKYMLKYGTLDFESGQKNGEGLASVLKDVDDPAKFRDYAMAKKALESDELGKETGIAKEDAQKIVDTDQEKYQPVFQRLVDLQNRMLKYAADSGVLGQDSYNRMIESRKSPIPFYRVQDEQPFIAEPNGGEGKLFSEMKGSKRQILDPFQSLAYNMAAIAKAAEKNRALTSFTEQVKGSMNGDYYAEKTEDNAKRPLGENEFVVMNDGKREIWRTNKDLSDAFKTLDYHPGLSGLLMNVFMKPLAALLRAGTVFNPDFLVRHFTRGNIIAGIQSKFGQIPIYDSLKAIGHMWKEDSVWQDFLKTGGASDASVELNHYLENNIWDLNKEAGSTMSRVWNAVTHPIQALALVAELNDNAPRLAEAQKSGMLNGDLAGQIEAGSAAREITLDYMRAGAKVRAVSSIIPFMNVSIQGTSRTVRAFAENPLKMTAMSAAAITLPSILNWWVNKDDSRYKDAANWEKDLYWLIMGPDKWEKSTLADALDRPKDLQRQAPDGSWEVNNGRIYRIPKPFELGVLMGSLPERALNALYQKDPSQFKDFDSTIIHGLMPNLLPTAVTPIMEQGNNKSYFTGNPLVSNQSEKVLPAYQYTDYTSETAKQLGKIVSSIPGLRDVGPKDAKLASPEVIDNYIRTWSGTLGVYAVQLADKGLHEAGIGNTTAKPDTPLEYMPFIKAFMVKYPSSKVQVINDFEERANLAQKEFATAKMLSKTNQDFTPEDERLAGAQKALSHQRQVIQKTYDNTDYTSAEKTQIIDQTYWAMIQIAKDGLQQMKNKGETTPKGK